MAELGKMELKKVEISRIKEGVCFNAPVFFDDGVNMFLAANRPAKRYHLNAIARWKVTSLLSSGQEVDPKSATATSAAAPSSTASTPVKKVPSTPAPSFEEVDLNSIGSQDDDNDIEELEELEELEEVGELEEL